MAEEIGTPFEKFRDRIMFLQDTGDPEEINLSQKQINNLADCLHNNKASTQIIFAAGFEAGFTTAIDKVKERLGIP